MWDGDERKTALKFDSEGKMVTPVACARYLLSSGQKSVYKSRPVVLVGRYFSG
jgi:hypothetical protein